jgi:hypothetical protein
VKAKKVIRSSVGLLLRSIILPAAGRSKDPALKLMGNRLLTFRAVVRVNHIETSRRKAAGQDESGGPVPEETRVFRKALEKGRNIDGLENLIMANNDFPGLAGKKG